MTRDELEKEALYFYDVFPYQAKFMLVMSLIQNCPTEVLEKILGKAKEKKLEKVAI